VKKQPRQEQNSHAIIFAWEFCSFKIAFPENGKSICQYRRFYQNIDGELPSGRPDTISNSSSANSIPQSIEKKFFGEYT
jgi:hypothetical protein